MIRRPPRSTRTDTLFPTRRSSDLSFPAAAQPVLAQPAAALRHARPADRRPWPVPHPSGAPRRSEEHTSELQSLMRISYAVFCLKKQKQPHKHQSDLIQHINSTHYTTYYTRRKTTYHSSDQS